VSGCDQSQRGKTGRFFLACLVSSIERIWWWLCAAVREESVAHLRSRVSLSLSLSVLGVSISEFERSQWITDARGSCSRTGRDGRGRTRWDRTFGTGCLGGVVRDSRASLIDRVINPIRARRARLARRKSARAKLLFMLNLHLFFLVSTLIT